MYSKLLYEIFFYTNCLAELTTLKTSILQAYSILSISIQNILSIQNKTVKYFLFKDSIIFSTRNEPHNQPKQ